MKTIDSEIRNIIKAIPHAFWIRLGAPVLHYNEIWETMRKAR